MRENAARDIWRRPEQGEKAVNMASRLDQAMRRARKGGEGEGEMAEGPRKRMGEMAGYIEIRSWGKGSPPAGWVGSWRKGSPPAGWVGVE